MAYNRLVTMSDPAPSLSAAPGAATTPATIHAERAAGTLAIEWRDGHRTTYDTVTLRWMCPCAFCRGEAGLPGWLDSAPELSAEQTRLVDIQLVGQYAVAPTWGDGHHTGYYTFSALRGMCPCEECAARRASEGHPTIGRTDHSSHANGTEPEPGGHAR